MPNPKKPRNNCLNCGEECARATYIYCSNKCQRGHQSKRLREEWYNNQSMPSWDTIKSILFQDRENKCSCCNISEWNGKSIVLEVDHIDGNSENNRPENLRFICPNCHSQTDTYKARNIGKGRHYRRERYAAGQSY
jgi:hypothetical protein